MAVWSHHTLVQMGWSPNVSSSFNTLAMCVNAAAISGLVSLGYYNVYYWDMPSMPLLPGEE